jgi:hypothetical protein
LQEHLPRPITRKRVLTRYSNNENYIIKCIISRVFDLAIDVLGALREFGYENILSANGPKPWFRSFWK